MMDLCEERVNDLRKDISSNDNLSQKWWCYLKSIGATLLKRDQIFPKRSETTDDMEDEDYNKLCDEFLKDLSNKTGMFPCYMINEVKRNKPIFSINQSGLIQWDGFLLPMNTAEKILTLGFFP